MLPTKEEMEAAFRARHGEELQKRFGSSVVAICGLGGLGSNVSIALARAGIGRLILIDFDRVDVSNLHRQQYKAAQVGLYKTEALADNLREIMPYLQIETHTEKITPENMEALLEKADIVCEAFDRAEEKAMLVNGILERFPEKYLVCASGMAGLDSANRILTRKVTGHFFVCGDGESDVAKSEGLFASRVMICAAHEANQILRIIAGETRV